MQNKSTQQDIEANQNVSVKSINGDELKQLLFAGLLWLKANQEFVNSLNVFPVPDGDTGTNMSLTMNSAFSEIENLQETNVGIVIKKFSHGALMGARGNSGVILSQLFRGFARSLDENDEINADLLVKALEESRNTAYKGVVRPVEGTILTVAKDIARAVEEIREKTDDLLEILRELVKESDESVKRTPDLLPILKQAGVVDSGGKGLFYILEGMLRYCDGLSLEMAEDIPVSIDFDQIDQNGFHESIEPGQDFEIVVDFEPNKTFELPKFYNVLENIGTSIQVGEGEDLYRMHIHVAEDKKYEPIDVVGNFGVVKKVYIENLMEQLENKRTSDDGPKVEISEGQIAVIAVSPGAGISKIFRSLGVCEVIQGGQTMNPSTEEIVESFKELPTDKVIILPNNKNIILAAKAACEITDKNAVVVPTTSIPQGLTASLMINPDGQLDDVVDDMQDIIRDVDSGEVTTATRSIDIDGVDVKEGEVISILNDKLVGSNKSLKQACEDLLNSVDLDLKEHVTILYGNNVNEKQVDNVIKHIEKKFPELELEIHNGGQPHYQFIISIE